MEVINVFCEKIEIRKMIDTRSSELIIASMMFDMGPAAAEMAMPDFGF